MKIIKSFFLVTVSLCATNLLHAQEATTTPVKPVESIPAVIVTKPVPVPDMNPGSKIIPTATTTNTAQSSPSPLKREEHVKPPEENKPTLKIIDGEKATDPLSAENVKTLAGKAEKPKQIAMAPGTIDPNAKPAPVTRSAVLKAKENQ